MANSKGNQYPLWYISNEQQVMAVAHNGKTYEKSQAGFAADIGISEDGTVWVISEIPDPDGGGARIFWSNGDSNWNEISTSDPGGKIITGAEGSNCMYLTASDEVYTLNPQGKATLDFKGLNIQEISYGGNYLWGVLPENSGGIPVLRYLKVTDPSKTWHTFTGNITPSSISTGYAGNCSAVVKRNPMYFLTDGTSSGSMGTGADGQTLSITFRNWCFILNTNANENGNQIMEFQSGGAGSFVAMAVRGTRVESSYYQVSES